MVATLLPLNPSWLGVWALVANFLASYLLDGFQPSEIFGRSTDTGRVPGRQTGVELASPLPNSTEFRRKERHQRILACEPKPLDSGSVLRE